MKRFRSLQSPPVLRFILLAVACASPLSSAQPGPGPTHGWTDEQRAVMQERMREWRERSPEQREQIRKRFEHFRRLSPEQQSRLQERFREFQALPEEERRALRERFRNRGEGPPHSFRGRSQAPITSERSRRRSQH